MSVISKLEFKIADHVSELTEPFNGMNEEYVKLIRAYHETYLDETRTEEHKRQQRASTKNLILDLVSERVNRAKEAIADIKKQYVGSKEAPELRAEERVFNVLYWKEIFHYADYSELEQLHSENSTDPVFKKLLYNELKRREIEKPAHYNLSKQTKLIENIEQEMEFPELDKLEQIMEHMRATSREHFYYNIQEYIASGTEIKPRTINNDLDAFPITDTSKGGTFRPLFSLPEVS